MFNNLVSSIHFFFPSKITGGTEYLFIRLSKYIVKNYGIKVFYIDYKDGFARKLIIEDNIKFIDFNENEKIEIKNSVIITPVCYFNEIKNYFVLDNSVRLFFWSIHPLNIISLFSGSQYYLHCNSLLIKIIIKFLFFEKYFIVKKLILDLYNNYSLVFMDLCNYDINQKVFNLGIKNIDYLAIPLEESKLFAKVTNISNTQINIGWLGRLSKDKVNSLLNILENIFKYSKKNNKKIIIHIIGNGSEETLIKDFVKVNNIEAIFIGTLIEKELEEYLTNNVDILFAMGTSCLEGARLKLPSILLDGGLAKINSEKYKFRWLYEEIGCNLGYCYPNIGLQNKYSFKEVLEEIYLKNNKEKIGNLCYDYYMKNHSMKNVCEKFLNLISKSNYNFEKLRQSGIYDTTIIEKIILYSKKLKKYLINKFYIKY